ncbi:deoxyribodipyrimidine photo-lyase [Aquimarina sp. 2201CG5-10]|uniref:cryptochrome/photolyase family protein n=1 Tax=Aquimarina callyspongiae TaxID=3098150 RepID=UPI002AB40D2E|nr:deoxyribodipyrimidine photo-lyase [Aquimarina sp. 2201CG5-10]MDY8136325.1 deoxyribodipyrimidine photo-lyase [Aquimarina sp. 2201CG5-10]
MKDKVSIFWFRRDLRLEDNTGLSEALKGSNPVLPIFIFDKNILDHLPKDDPRVSFIYERLHKIKTELQAKYNSSLALFYDTPKKVFEHLISKYEIECVYTNHDYEPYATERDIHIKTILSKSNIEFSTFKDQVIFEKDEIVKSDGTPYVVYTPYKNKWKELFSKSQLEASSITRNTHNFIKDKNLVFFTLNDIGFTQSSIKVRDYDVSARLIQNYEATRNFPGLSNGTSLLSPHLRFGTVSIRNIVNLAISQENQVFWSELIWREFFMQILWHYPHTKNKSFRPKYDRIQWRNNEEEFNKWKNGQTGYPLVDAGMRQLNQTGYMHNRVRMIVASFLCKHLLIDWRWGEAYFAEKLLDYDLAANIGNWQWAAGSGVDAAPYFRIFNPTTQIAKFDKKLDYIKTWVKDLNDFTYPQPIIDHKIARERCLKTYKEALL